MAIIQLINGPNLNMLGTREPKHYGNSSLDNIVDQLQQELEGTGHTLVHYQSNHEGELIDYIQKLQGERATCMMLNPAGLTHTSVALRDAIIAAEIAFIEVHLSNIYAREPFRRHSYFSDIALGVICGLGSQGYKLALQAAIEYCYQQKI